MIPTIPTINLTGCPFHRLRTRATFKKILIAVLLILTTSVTAEGQTKLSQESAEAIDQMLTDYFPKNEPGAVAIMAKDGKIVYHKAYGLANLEFQVPMSLNSKFMIGSISKPIVAAAVLRLAEQGKLSVEDNITKHLKDYPAPNSEVKIKHLLTHTSGIHNYNNFDEPHPPGYFTRNYTDREFIDLFKNIPLDFEPGLRFEYSNSGYVLLGAIIERVSGKRFEDYLQDEFWSPLNLRSIGRVEPRFTSRDRTPGYYWTGRNYLVPDHEGRAFTRSCAGSIESTAHDLMRWCDAFLSDQVLQEPTRIAATTPFVLNDQSISRTGYGWFTGNLGGSPIYAHDGLTPGHSSSLIILPKEKIVSLILINRNWVADQRGGELPGLPHRMAAILIGKPYGDGVASTTEELQSLTGVYQSEDAKRLTITQQGNRLFSQKEHGRRAPMFRFPDGCFYAERGYETFKFNTNPNPTTVTVDGRQQVRYHRTNDPLPRRSLSQLVLETIQRDGSATGLKLFTQLGSSEKVYLNRREMFRLATTLYESGDVATTTEVLKLAVKLFPEETKSPEYSAFEKAIGGRMQTAINLLESAANNGVLIEDEVNRIGYSFLRHGKNKAAIAFLKVNAKTFPDSWNANDSLAEASLADGQKEFAKKYYRISVKLNPQNWDGLLALERLKSPK